MRFQYKLLSQHSTLLRALSKIRQQHLSNRSVCICGRPWFLGRLEGTRRRKRTNDYARTWEWEAWLYKTSWLYKAIVTTENHRDTAD